MFGMRTRHNKPPSPSDPWSLDRALLCFERGDAWTIRDAAACTQIFGDTGSGKTTGSGQAIARAMLKAGFGGLVLTVKPNETERWRGYMKDAGREDDLIVFSPEGPHRFNFLEHERTRASRGGGATENLVELFVTALSAGAPAGGGGGSQDPFWERALRQLLRNTIDALRLGGEPLTVDRMRRLIASAALSPEQAEDDAWRDRSYLFQTLLKAEVRCTDARERRDLAITTEFWQEEFTGVMDPRTRGNIVSTFTTMADGFLRGDLCELFCTDLTLTPEATFEGKVIVLDLPSKQFHTLGAQAQVIWKACWQRAVEAASRGPDSRPVFLWVDEAQYFITPGEPEFVQTVREQKACCVYLTQARSNYLHALGPGREAAVESFLGVAKTKIFHCNGDPDTNEWAQRVISEDWQTQASEGRTEGDAGNPGDRTTSTITRVREPRISTADFGKLRCGGPPYFKVQAILFQSGRDFRGGEGNIVRLSFRQHARARSATR
jgi:hypothetical protein